MEIVWLLLGLVAGGAVGWLWSSVRSGQQLGTLRTASEAQLQQASAQTQAEREARIAADTRLEETNKRIEAQRALLDEATARMSETFKAISSDALQTNSQSFITSAKQTLEPLQQLLNRYEQQLSVIESERQRAYGSLEKQLTQLAVSEQQLQRETTNLVHALRRPQVRGRWGELSLRRAVELAGMSEHVDFSEQVSTETEGGRLRPDMIVHLPGGRDIVVDAKVSLEGYLNALEALDEQARGVCIADHCRQMKDHIRGLSAKNYWDQFPSVPEFVVMFVPGESFLEAACSVDNMLIENAMENRVVVASPTTLVALLRAVAYGWRHEQIEENAQQISELGAELYRRVRTFLGHFAKIGRELESANEAYNAAVGSLERNVLPQARRFKDLGAASGDDVPEITSLDLTPRQLTVPEMEEE